MELICAQEWDEHFFLEFLNFKAKIHQNIETSFPESIEDYSKYFSSTSPFGKDYHWKGLIVKENGEVVAKAILSWKHVGIVGNLVFVDWLNHPQAAIFLIENVEAIAKANGLKSIRTPVDLNFFLKYRIREPGGAFPLYGEPIYPDYYHGLYKLTGHQVIGKWDTYQVKRWAGMKDWFFKRKLLSHKPTGPGPKTPEKKQKLKIRCVRLSDWDNELRIIHRLFSQAYSHMPEYESISFEQFRIIYDDFKYIINPFYSYILELNSNPVAFSINYVDPLPLLLPHKGKKISTLKKALLLLKLRLNNGTYLITHVGKIPGPDGEEVKGVQILVSKRITLTSFFMRRFVVTFQNVYSPSRRSWNPDIWIPHASYVLYGKNLCK